MSFENNYNVIEYINGHCKNLGKDDLENNIYPNK
jgi:hypothetical protein